MADEAVLVSVVQVVELLKDNLQLLSRSHGELVGALHLLLLSQV